MIVVMTIKGRSYPQKAEIDEAEINNIPGARVRWDEKYYSKKLGTDVVKHHTSFIGDSYIQDIATIERVDGEPVDFDNIPDREYGKK